jgi:hypothetical protein
MTALKRLVSQYRDALREEPKLRAFALAAFIDDIGVAVSTWAGTLLMTSLMTDQGVRASLKVPSLVCFLAGTLVSGPLADWAQGESLARFRYQLVIWARLIETGMLGVLVLQLGVGAPTLAKLAPFLMLTAFTQTAFRPARIAFSVDILRRESTQLGPDGQPLLDERGQTLTSKTHLLTSFSLISALASAATLAGLLIGGQLMAWAQGAYRPLMFAQMIAQLGFVLVIALFCHPDKSVRELRWRDIWPDIKSSNTSNTSVRERLAKLVRSERDVFSFLFQRQQRELLILLAAGALVEFAVEAYDGNMIIKHILHGSDDSMRYAELALAVAAMLAMAAVPALARSLNNLGQIFVLTMLLDGVVIALAGGAARAQVPAAVAPFTAFLIVDQLLTSVSCSLRDLLQNSASSSAMRGRINGTYAMFVILGDMVTQGLATVAADSVGIPSMMQGVGILQVAAVLGLLLWGGRKLWQLGLHELERVLA